MPADGYRHVAGATAAPPGGYDADIIILALNRADETLEAIASALAQNGGRFHLFILDQGSAAGTLARLASSVEGRADATLVASGKNLGVSGGRNLASAFGHGRIIVGLDNDAAFANTFTVAQAVAAFDVSAELGAIGFRIVRHDTGQDDLSSWGYPAGLIPKAGEAFDSVTFVGAGHAIRRAAWDQAGGYDAAMFFCWEEFDFCLRAIEAGWRIRYRGDIAVRHRVAPEARMRWSDARWFYFIRNRLYIGHKTGAGRADLAARFACYALRCLREGALWQALRALPAAVRLAGDAPCQPLSPATLEYLRRNDTLHRWPAWLRTARVKAPPPPPREALPALRR
jgi:GT2 family glycosyltransferase